LALGYNHTMVRTAYVVLAVALVGCIIPFGGSAHFSPTGANVYPAKKSPCGLEILMSTPARTFDEIGVFDINGGDLDTLDKLRASVTDDACRVGADAVVASANGQGYYIKALAIRYRSPAPGESVPPPQ
jgi:hypothetical protein